MPQKDQLLLQARGCQHSSERTHVLPLQQAVHDGARCGGAGAASCALRCAADCQVVGARGRGVACAASPQCGNGAHTRVCMSCVRACVPACMRACQRACTQPSVGLKIKGTQPTRLLAQVARLVWAVHIDSALEARAVPCLTTHLQARACAGGRAAICAAGHACHVRGAQLPAGGLDHAKPARRCVPVLGTPGWRTHAARALLGRVSLTGCASQHVIIPFPFFEPLVLAAAAAPLLRTHMACGAFVDRHVQLPRGRLRRTRGPCLLCLFILVAVTTIQGALILVAVTIAVRALHHSNSLTLVACHLFC